MATNNRMKRCDNAFVSTRGDLLSKDERRKLENIFITPGKIGGYSRSRQKSDVWKFYGILMYRDDDTAPVAIDDNRHYCAPCLKKVQDVPEGRGHMSQVQSYNRATSTCALIDHLKIVHEIDLKKVGLCVVLSLCITPMLCLIIT